MTEKSMREHAVKVLSDLLQDNVGQRLTPALGTGIATLFNQALWQLEVEQSVTPTEGVKND